MSDCPESDAYDQGFKDGIDVERMNAPSSNTVDPLVRQAIGHLRGLVDILGKCDNFDHHGYCQTHFIEDPCRVAKARKFLDSLPMEGKTMDRPSCGTCKHFTDVGYRRWGECTAQVPC